MPLPESNLSEIVKPSESEAEPGAQDEAEAQTVQQNQTPQQDESAVEAPVVTNEQTENEDSTKPEFKPAEDVVKPSGSNKYTSAGHIATSSKSASKSILGNQKAVQNGTASPPASPKQPDVNTNKGDPKDDIPHSVTDHDSLNADSLQDVEPKMSATQRLEDVEDEFFEDDNTQTDTQSDHPIIMAILIVLLIILALLFLAYHLYMRRKIAEVQKNGEDALWDLRLQHQQQKEWADVSKSRKSNAEASQAELNKEIASLKQDRENALLDKNAALTEKEKALQEKDKAVSDRDKTLREMSQAHQEIEKVRAEKEQVLSQVDKARTETTQALSEKNAAISERDAALSERDAALTLLAEKDAKLVEQADALNAKDAALAQKEQELTNVVAQLEEIRKSNVVVTDSSTSDQSHETSDPSSVVVDNSHTDSVPADAISVVPSNSDDHNDEIRTMRKILIGKMELARTLLDMKGEKKGEVISDSEWKDIEFFLEKVDNKFVSRFSKQFPDLTGKEIQLMMLLRLRVPSKNIAQIYGINEKSVKQKLFVYKAKVGMENDQASLRDYIETF